MAGAGQRTWGAPWKWGRHQHQRPHGKVLKAAPCEWRLPGRNEAAGADGRRVPSRHPRGPRRPVRPRDVGQGPPTRLGEEATLKEPCASNSEGAAKGTAWMVRKADREEGEDERPVGRKRRPARSPSGQGTHSKAPRALLSPSRAGGRAAEREASAAGALPEAEFTRVCSAVLACGFKTGQVCSP